MNYSDERDKNWVRSKQTPQFDKLYGDRLYYFDIGGECGVKHDDDIIYYRLNCSYWFGDWIEANAGKDQYTIYGVPYRAIYIVREDLMTFIKLKWL